MDTKVVNIMGVPMELEDFSQPDMVRDAQSILSDLEALRAWFLKNPSPLANMRITDASGRVTGYAHWSTKMKQLVASIDSQLKGKR